MSYHIHILKLCCQEPLAAGKLYFRIHNTTRCHLNSTRPVQRRPGCRGQPIIGPALCLSVEPDKGAVLFPPPEGICGWSERRKRDKEPLHPLLWCKYSKLILSSVQVCCNTNKEEKPQSFTFCLAND